MNEKLQFAKFKEEDFSEYLSWYKDPDLNMQLGPMTDKDIEYDTKSDEEGCSYSVFKNKKLVAVIGIAFPDNTHPTFTITHIAVNPALRSTGIGRQVLDGIIKLHPAHNGQYWVAHVDVKNPRAKLFFENNGWVCNSDPKDINDMYLFRFTEAI